MFSDLQQFSTEHRDTGRSIAHFVVLYLGNVHEHLGGCIVQVDAAQNGGTVIRDGNASIVGRNGLQNLVHPLGTQCRLDKIGNGNGAYK